MYDGSLLMETAEKLLVEIEKGKKEDIKMQKNYIRFSIRKNKINS